MVVEKANEIHRFLWDSIFPQDLPKTVAMNTVKSLLIVNEVYVRGAFYSRHYSIMFLSTNIWCVHPWPLRKPACSLRRNFKGVDGILDTVKENLARLYLV